MCRTEGSRVGRLHLRLCKTHGLDDDELRIYPSFLLFTSGQDWSPVDYGHAAAVIDTIYNIVVLLNGGPPAISRLIFSADDFNSATGTEYFLPGRQQAEFIEEKGTGMLTEAFADELALAWNGLCAVGQDRMGRIRRALDGYYYAWRSAYADQMCLHLAVALETLFAPSSKSELAHQVSVNVAHFVGSSPEEKKHVYSVVKRMYDMRSQVVHGSKPKEEKLLLSVREGFPLATRALRRILLSRDLLETFADEHARMEMLKGYLFG